MTPTVPLTPGAILTGGVSWFGGPNDPSSGPTTASGKPISGGGIAVYNEATLGGWWRVTFPNGRQAVLQQTDIGPAPWTGRKVDVAYTSLAAAGYTEHDFPTNATVRAEYLGKATPAGANLAGGGASETTTPTVAGGTGAVAGAPGGLVGIATKGLVYLAFLLGGAAALWMGAKTVLSPNRQPAA